MNNSLDNSKSSKGSKVPYMGCQSLYYQNRINKHTDSIRSKDAVDLNGWGSDSSIDKRRVVAMRSNNQVNMNNSIAMGTNSGNNTRRHQLYQLHHQSVPTGVLIHQHSPQSIRSFSTFHSDNTLCGINGIVTKDSNYGDVDTRDCNYGDVDTRDCNFEDGRLQEFSDDETQLDATVYDMPPSEINTIDRTTCSRINTLQHFNHKNEQIMLTNQNSEMTHESNIIEVQTKSSLLRKSSRKPPNNNEKENNNLRNNSFFLCALGLKTPHSALNKSLDSLPEAEHLKANIKPLFEILPNKGPVQITNTKRKKSNKKQNQSFDEFYWSRNIIKKPISENVSKSLWKTSFKLFKTIQKFMGDRRTKKSPSDLLNLITNKFCPKDNSLRDEVFLQICKQTNNNPDRLSTSRGLELLCECLQLCPPPSHSMLQFLESHISTALDNITDNTSDPLFVLLHRCRECLDSLNRINYTPTNQNNYSPIDPTDFINTKHIRHRSLTEVFRDFSSIKSFFNQTLSCQMLIQNHVFPNYEVPLILSSLCTQIQFDLEQNDQFTTLYKESIQLAQSKCTLTNQLTEAVKLIDNWCVSMCNKKSFRAPNLSIIALAVLIHWFECLPQPIISSKSVLLMDFISDFSISSLSLVNQSVLRYVINFFQDQVINQSRDTLFNIASFLCPLLFQLPQHDYYPHVNYQESNYTKFIINLFHIISQQT